MNFEEQRTTAPTQYSSYAHEESFFTFADFIRACVRYWLLISSIIVIAAISGVLYFKSRPQAPFIFLTAIEIGANGGGALLEERTSVEAKLENAFIPQALAQHALARGYEN